MCCCVIYGGEMKHRSLLAWIAIVAIVMLSIFVGVYMKSYNQSGKISEGVYGIKDLEYLNPISSSTPDYFLEKNQGTLFAFYNDEFTIDSSSSALDAATPLQSFSDVTDEEISLRNTLNLMNDVNEGLNLSKYTKKRAFRIFSKSVDTGYTIYLLDNEVWLSHIYPNSKLQYVDYLFSLQLDELQNQTAAEILSILKAADFPIKESIIINEQNDPSHLLGTANAYISKAQWTDSRGVKPNRCHVTVEVFRTWSDCAQWKDSLEKLYSFMSSDGYYFFSEGSALISVQNGITQKQAAIYGEALQAIKQGDLPKHD